MYIRRENQEIVNLLRDIDTKLTTLQLDNSAEKADNVVWNLTQAQYELSKELCQGLMVLKQVIREGEQHISQAKAKYEK